MTHNQKLRFIKMNTHLLTSPILTPEQRKLKLITRRVMKSLATPIKGDFYAK